MKQSMRFVCLLGILLGTVPVAAEPAAPAAGQEQAAPAPGSAADVQALKEEIERLRQQEEENRRQQEEQIRALEQKLEDLQKTPPAPAAPAAAAPKPVTTRSGFHAHLYGFARVDMDVNSRPMFAGPQLPFWVLSPADPRAAGRTNGEYTLHSRLTRLGVDTDGERIRRLGNAKFSGKIEVDFFNVLPDKNSATSNSRAFLRMRHAYGQLTWPHSYLLFGQTWDLISPLYPAANFDVLMWNAGNLGDRRPQLRYVWEPPVGRGRGSVGIAVGDPSAVDAQDLDPDEVTDGEESGRPELQARLALNQPSWVRGQTWELGVWGHNAQFKINRNKAINGHYSWNSDVLGIDGRIPLTRKLLLQGEGWYGKALADVRGGVGQNINTITGQAVHSRGGWAEMLYQWNSVYTLGGGYTVDSPDSNDVTPFTGNNQTSVGRTLNRSYYIVNHFSPGGGLALGLDWMFFRTKYRGLSPGSSNRWNLWLQQNF